MIAGIRVPRHSGVSCSGLGFWDSVIDFIDVGEINYADFADFGLDNVQFNALDFAPFNASDAGFELMPVADLDIATYEAAEYVPEYEFVEDVPIDSPYDTGENLVNNPSVFNSAPVTSSSLPTIPRLADSPTTAQSKAGTIWDVSPKAVSSVVDAAGRVLTKQGQIDANRALLERQALLYPKGVPIPGTGILDQLATSFKTNPVPFIIGGVSIALMLARSKDK